MREKSEGFQTWITVGRMLPSLSLFTATFVQAADSVCAGSKCARTHTRKGGGGGREEGGEGEGAEASARERGRERERRELGEGRER